MYHDGAGILFVRFNGVHVAMHVDEFGNLIQYGIVCNSMELHVYKLARNRVRVSLFKSWFPLFSTFFETLKNVPFLCFQAIFCVFPILHCFSTICGYFPLLIPLKKRLCLRVRIHICMIFPGKKHFVWLVYSYIIHGFH